MSLPQNVKQHKRTCKKNATFFYSLFFSSFCTHNHQFMIIISIYPELFSTEMEMQIEKNNKKNFKTHD